VGPYDTKSVAVFWLLYQGNISKGVKEIGHSLAFFLANLLASTPETKSNTTKAHIHK